MFEYFFQFLIFLELFYRFFTDFYKQFAIIIPVLESMNKQNGLRLEDHPLDKARFLLLNFIDFKTRNQVRAPHHRIAPDYPHPKV